MTERSESERAEALADRLAVFTKLSPHDFFEQSLSGSQLQLIVTALRSLAAQDQKPVAYRYRSPNPAEQHTWYYTHTRRPKECDGWLVEQLYLSPPPAAGWPTKCHDPDSCARHQDCMYVDCPYSGTDIKPAVEEALRHNAPPDSGAGKSEPELPPLTCDFAQAFPDGTIDDSTYGKIEDALDKIDATCQDANGKWLSLHDRILALSNPVAANASAEARLREALEDIAADHDCGCSPCTGQCRSQESLRITVDEMRDIAREALSAHPHASDAKECCDLAAKEPCADCPFPNPDAAMRGLTDLERALLIAAKAGLNYIANTESELGMTLKSGDLLRAAIAKAEACALSTHPLASDCDKQGETTNSEASSHEKRRLDASGEQTSTGPETSISPVRIIAQRHVSAPSANHDVTAGRDRQPSDRTADVTVDELAIFLHDNFLKLGGWKDFARDVLHAFTVWRR